jgi:hypothetical protein
VLMIVYAMTRVPNPITNGRALSISGIGIARDISIRVYNNNCVDNSQRKDNTCKPKTRIKVTVRIYATYLNVKIMKVRSNTFISQPTVLSWLLQLQPLGNAYFRTTSIPF